MHAENQQEKVSDREELKQIQITTTTTVLRPFIWDYLGGPILQQISTALLQNAIAKSVKDFPKWLEASVSANGGHFEYNMWTLM